MEAEADPAPEIGALSFAVNSNMAVARYVDDGGTRAGALIEIAATKKHSPWNAAERGGRPAEE
eukprot:10470809-Alexandrium_andersonii.AAC.1